MDTKLIKQYGEDILSYRLRSAREKKRAQHKDFEKNLLRIHREELDLLRRRKNLGWIELIPPVQKGWKRYYVLREDVAASKDAKFFEGILKKINSHQWSSRKDFKVRGREKGKKVYGVRPQKLSEPSYWNFPKMEFTKEEKQYFTLEHRIEKISNIIILYYVFRQPWRFVLRVRPNIVDKIRIKDGELESKIDRIHNYLEYNCYRKKLIRLLNGAARRCSVDTSHLHNWNAIKGKPASMILNLINDGKI